jgi:hypothetical protein
VGAEFRVDSAQAGCEVKFCDCGAEAGPAGLIGEPCGCVITLCIQCEVRLEVLAVAQDRHRQKRHCQSCGAKVDQKTEGAVIYPDGIKCMACFPGWATSVDSPSRSEPEPTYKGWDRGGIQGHRLEVKDAETLECSVCHATTGRDFQGFEPIGMLLLTGPRLCGNLLTVGDNGKRYGIYDNVFGQSTGSLGAPSPGTTVKVNFRQGQTVESAKFHDLAYWAPKLAVTAVDPKDDAKVEKLVKFLNWQFTKEFLAERSKEMAVRRFSLPTEPASGSGCYLCTEGSPITDPCPSCRRASLPSHD